MSGGNFIFDLQRFGDVNYTDSTTLTGTNDNDSIQNAGNYVTIQALGGNDYIDIYGTAPSVTAFSAGKYNLILAGDGNDFITNSGVNAIIDGGNDNDTVGNNSYGVNTTITGGVGNDSILNSAKAIIYGGDGADTLTNTNLGANTTLFGNYGNDFISTYNADNVLMNGGADDDTIDVRGNAYGITVTGGTGNDSIKNSSENVLFQYATGDGNDYISGFNANSTLQIGGGKGTYSSQTSGSDIIVTVGNGEVTLEGAANLSTVNIDGISDNPSPTLTVTNSTKSPVTVDSAVKVINASKRTKAVNITGNDNSNSIIGGKGADTLNGGKGNDTLTGNKGNDLFVYSAGNDVITDYTEEDKISISGTAQVTTSGSDVVFTIGANKLTVIGGKDKNITYVDAGGEQVYPEQNSDVIINGKVITLTEDYLEDSFNVADYGANLQTIDASAVQLDLKITGNKLRNSIKGGANNETLIGGKGNDTLTGGAGSDVFVYAKGDGNDVITDYKEEDIIRLTKGTAKVEKKNKDVIFTVGSGKITVKGAANKIVTYIDAKGKTNYYPAPTKDSIIINGTSVTVLEEYKNATFDVVGKVTNGNNVKRIDASPVSHDLKIVGNAKANIILGGYGDDTIYGGKNNDTLQGGDGADTFVYAKGDGKDIILDYEEDDTIKITKGKATVTKKGSDVVFTVGSGKITLNGAAGKTISYIDANGNKKTYGSAPSFIVDDNNYELTPNLSSLVQSKAVDYSFLSTSTKLSKETNLIAYVKK